MCNGNKITKNGRLTPGKQSDGYKSNGLFRSKPQTILTNVMDNGSPDRPSELKPHILYTCSKEDNRRKMTFFSICFSHRVCATTTTKDLILLYFLRELMTG